MTAFYIFCVVFGASVVLLLFRIAKNQVFLGKYLNDIRNLLAKK